MGLYITDKIISIIHHWASEMQSTLVIRDPKNIINELNQQL